jgi:hypothetical protein
MKRAVAVRRPARQTQKRTVQSSSDRPLRVVNDPAKALEVVGLAEWAL